MECHLDDGIFMKCKIRNAFILFFISTSILILTLFSEYRCYKTILFYEYNFKNELAINQVFFMLGFQYKQNFDECPEKRTFTDKLEIQCYPKNAKNYIILYYKSKITNYMIKSILNNKSDAKTFRGYFPDDFYKQYFSEIFEWSLKDRKIYLTEFDNIKKICIKEIQEQRNPKISNPRWEDENGKAISKALVGDTITFAYDFGDGWTFPIRLEEIIDDKVYEEVSSLILDGEGLGIIEDVGGVGAMSDCVKAIEKKSGEDYSEWLGLKDLDITYFNKCAVNKSLKNEIKAIDKAYKTME